MAFIANAGDACNAMTDAATKEMLCFFSIFCESKEQKEARKSVPEESDDGLKEKNSVSENAHDGC